jgi:hypothetical protein
MTRFILAMLIATTLLTMPAQAGCWYERTMFGWVVRCG